MPEKKSDPKIGLCEAAFKLSSKDGRIPAFAKTLKLVHVFQESGAKGISIVERHVYQSRFLN